ncbi:MAG: serine protease [Nitrosomonadales bacterium]
MKFIFFLFISLNVYSYPKQFELFELNKSMAQIWVSYPDGSSGTGSGVAVDSKHLVTNCHVIQNTSGVTAVKYHETYAPVKFYADWENDLCILEFDTLPITPVNVRPSKTLKLNEEVFSLTFPNDNPMPLPTNGNVKSLYPFHDEVIIRTSASFTVGSSGGALFDNDYNLVGITTFKSPGKRDGYFYCLPTELIKRVLENEPGENLKNNTPPFWALPDHQKPFFMQVIIPTVNKDWENLRAISKLWTQADEDSSDAWYYLGLAEENFNEDYAKLFLKKSVQLNNSNLDPLLELYKLYKNNNNVTESHYYLDKIKSLDDSFDENQ